MTNATWGEFKQAVEAHGVTDDTAIWFVDVSFPRKDRAAQMVHIWKEEPNLGVGIVDG